MIVPQDTANHTDERFLMCESTRPIAGAAMPSLTVEKVGGGQVSIGSANDWQAVFVYRGKHCPLCRRYLAELNDHVDEFSSTGVEVVAVSADTREKAEAEANEEGWRFPVGYGLTMEQMRKLGVYVSEPRSAEETDRPFAEPGLFVVNPNNRMQIIDISNAPAARPALSILLLGLTFIMKNGLPARGTLSIAS